MSTSSAPALPALPFEQPQPVEQSQRVQSSPAAQPVDVDVLVVGAGQAGLSAAYHLRRRGFVPLGLDGLPSAGPDDGASPGDQRTFVVLDGAPAPGGAWQFRWPSLTMAQTHAVHDLPGLALDPGDPRESASTAVGRYFGAYEQLNDLRVLRPVGVREVRDDPGSGALLVEATTRDGPVTWRARTLVNATGTWTKPFWPWYPGRESFAGRQLHTHDFGAAEDFAGRRVVVVGGGASATQFLLQIAPHAASTTWVTRREPVWVGGPFDEDRGRDAVALVDERTRAGLAPESVVSVTGLPLTPVYEAGIASGVLRRLPMFSRVVPDGVAWDPGVRPDGVTHQGVDVILWATGFRAALDHLGPLGLRGPGGGIVMDGPTVVADPRVQLVGYGPSASTIGANRAGREAVRSVLRVLDGAATRGPSRLVVPVEPSGSVVPGPA
ncbi:NAD(P)-binding domain-containing protein [Oerskovia sp. Root918]|uniref:NAD(P)-binding domain-containing protein n=1 Tax=Oerskovia sp. Root918 TaxID=1736607 RepID=UPI001F399AA4|nr:NAD(P)-binding domain-containing protein [Oerskovia sp. Root918]